MAICVCEHSLILNSSLKASYEVCTGVMLLQQSKYKVLKVYSINCECYHRSVFHWGRRYFFFFLLKNIVSTGKNPLLRLFFPKYKIVTLILFGFELYCVTFVKSGGIKFKSNFNQLCYIKKNNKACLVY